MYPLVTENVEKKEITNDFIASWNFFLCAEYPYMNEFEITDII